MSVDVVYNGSFAVCVADFGEWLPGDVMTVTDELAKGLLVRDDFSEAKTKKPDPVVVKTEDAAKK
jgi:hypothetical protein